MLLFKDKSLTNRKCITFKDWSLFHWPELASTTEPLLLRFKRPDNKVAPVHPLRLAEGDQSGVVLPSEAPEDHAQGEPEIRVSLEVKKPGPRGNDNGLGDSQLKDRVEEAMFSELCTVQEYGQMKADILRYHCVRFQERDCSPRALYNSECPEDYFCQLSRSNSYQIN